MLDFLNAGGDAAAAARACLSHLLFLPRDEAMLENKHYYESVLHVDPELFTPRKVQTLTVHHVRVQYNMYSYITIT